MYLLDASSIVKAATQGMGAPRDSETIELAPYEAFNAVLMMVRRNILSLDEATYVLEELLGILGKIKITYIPLSEFRELYELVG